jgi:hypothetical protein
MFAQQYFKHFAAYGRKPFAALFAQRVRGAQRRFQRPDSQAVIGHVGNALVGSG